MENITTVFLNSLFKPFGDSVKNVTVEQAVEWLPLAFPGTSGMAEFFVSNLQLENPTSNLDEALFKYFKEFVEHMMFDVQDRTVYSPWDVLEMFQGTELSNIFGIEGMTTLPVTVIIGPNRMEHNLTKDLVEGLTTYMLMDPIFSLEMFGVPADPVIIIGKLEAFTTNHNPSEKMMIATFVSDQGNKRLIVNPNFMQGFNTGALWSGKNPNDFIEKLVTVDVDENGHLVETRLTMM